MTTKKAFQIGWYNVPEDTEMTDRGFECAAWSVTVAIKAGKYPVMSSGYQYHERDRRYTDKLDDRSISITLGGSVVCDDFQGHFCGKPIGPYDTKRNAGGPGSTGDITTTAISFPRTWVFSGNVSTASGPRRRGSASSSTRKRQR